MKKLLLIFSTILFFLFFSCDENTNLFIGGGEDTFNKITNAGKTCYSFIGINPVRYTSSRVEKYFPLGAELKPEYDFPAVVPGYTVGYWTWNDTQGTLITPSNLTLDGFNNNAVSKASVTFTELSFTAQGLTPRTDTPYTVKHYLQDADELYKYNLYETERKIGTTDTLIDLDACKKTYTELGFVEGEFYYGDERINGEGDSVYCIQYDRKLVTIDVISEAGTFVGYPSSQPLVQITGPYGSRIPLELKKHCFKLTGFETATGEIIKPSALERFPFENGTYTAQWQEVKLDTGTIEQPSDPKYRFVLMSGSRTLSDGSNVNHGENLSFVVYDGNTPLHEKSNVLSYSGYNNPFELIIKQNGEEIIHHYSDDPTRMRITIPIHLAITGAQIDVYMIVKTNDGNTYEDKVSLNVIKASIDKFTTIANFLSSNTGDQRITVEINDHSELQLLNTIMASNEVTVDSIDLTIKGSIDNLYSPGFRNCSKLKKVTLNEGLDFMNGHSFENCPILEEVYIPSTVQYIDSNSFYNCPNLKKITISSSNDRFSSTGAVIFNKDKTALHGYYEGSSVTEYTIPNTVKNIDIGAFDNASYLESLVISSDISVLASNIFSSCNSLKSVEFKDGVTKITSGLFYSCPLENVTLSDSVTTIESNAFGYTNIETFNITKNVSSIDTTAFYGCSRLESFTVDSGNENYTTLDGVLYNKDETSLILYPPSKQDSSYTIPATVTEISFSAFQNNNNLSSISFPDPTNWYSDPTYINRVDLSDPTNNLTLILQYGILYKKPANNGGTP